MSNELLIIIFTTFSFTLIFTVLVLIMRQFKETSYNQKEQKIELDKIRENLENKMYQLTSQLTSSPKRWHELNHLLVSSQDSQQSLLSDSNEFFTNMGITIDDFTLESNSVFVLTPFNNQFAHVYFQVQKTCSSIGLTCYRGDEQYIDGDVFTHIIRRILRSKIVIAIIDGRNPNVFYELGIAHAIGKPTILVSKSIDKTPFDVKSKRIVLYSSLPELNHNLKEELMKLFITKPSLSQPQNQSANPGLNSTIQLLFPGTWNNIYTFPNQKPITEEFEIRDGNKYFVSGNHRFNITNFNQNTDGSKITFTKEWVGTKSTPIINNLSRMNWGKYEGSESIGTTVIYERIK